MSRVKDTQLSDGDIKDIISLYKLGTSKLNIAKQFKRHHSTIIYHIKRQERIEGSAFIVRAKIPKRKETRSEPKNVFVFRRSPSYEDYVEQEQARMIERQAKCEHLEVIRTVKCKCCGHLDSVVYTAR